ncbi:MAG: metal-dependent transcriptional regulator [Saprospiraceae bacterium]|nr:metal-dependent transcriptional regulator [Saprospiraceae bacterium]
MLTKNEEDYLKGLYYLIHNDQLKKVGTNQLATQLNVKPASANNMLKKLKAKSLVSYQPYGPISFTSKGKKIALELIRKHRLWETFLYETLNFSWDEVHEVAEQLEHIKSKKLIDKLDKFLGYPETDPHGDPIPNSKGVSKSSKKVKLSTLDPGEKCRLVSVSDNSAAFLQYVSSLGLKLKSQIVVVQKMEEDNGMVILVDDRQFSVPEKFGENVFVIPD